MCHKCSISAQSSDLEFHGSPRLEFLPKTESIHKAVKLVII